MNNLDKNGGFLPMAGQGIEEAKSKHQAIDWEGVEIQFRAGIRTLKDIAKEYGISDAGILKRAKRDGWVRDLQAKIRAKAEAKVSEDAVSAELAPQKKLTENNVVEANATLLAQIRRDQRKDITRSRKLVMSLLTELEAQTDSQGLLQQLAELMHDVPNEPTAKQIADQGKRQEAFAKVISLSGRVTTMKSLADSLKTLVALEREAFGIDDRVKPPDEVPTTYNMKF